MCSPTSRLTPRRTYRHIPIVVTEETIGDLINQPWCRVEFPSVCRFSALYAITWKTYLQSSFELGGKPFALMMTGARPIASFSGFSWNSNHLEAQK